MDIATLFRLLSNLLAANMFELLHFNNDVDRTLMTAVLELVHSSCINSDAPPTTPLSQLTGLSCSVASRKMLNCGLEIWCLWDSVASWSHLQSVCQNELMVPRHKLSSLHVLACFYCHSHIHRSGIPRQIICVIWSLNSTLWASVKDILVCTLLGTTYWAH